MENGKDFRNPYQITIFSSEKKVFFFPKLEAFFFCSKNRKLTKISETYPNMRSQLQVFAEIHRFYEIEEKRLFFFNM